MEHKIVEYKTADEILERAHVAEGKTFGDFDINQRLASKGNKGGLGQIIEEGLFGYEINSKSEADFAEAGVELKVTPVKIVGKANSEKLSAKERLVLNIIDYMTEYDKAFYESSFWKKNEKILLMFYLWKPEQE
ncbi:MAG: restriction endonuclease, partial [Veillonella sp.]|nr:restriction endonuclease [Veillonella sp.]